MNKAKLIVSFLLTAAIASAESITLKNREAAELFSALTAIGPGLTAANSTIVARDINALKPAVEAFQNGNEASRLKYKVTKNTEIDAENGAGYLHETKENANNGVTLELTRVTISDDELVATKISPAIQSVILLYLSPLPPKK